MSYAKETLMKTALQEIFPNTSMPQHHSCKTLPKDVFQYLNVGSGIRPYSSSFSTLTGQITASIGRAQADMKTCIAFLS